MRVKPHLFLLVVVATLACGCGHLTSTVGLSPTYSNRTGGGFQVELGAGGGAAFVKGGQHGLDGTLATSIGGHANGSTVEFRLALQHSYLPAKWEGVGLRLGPLIGVRLDDGADFLLGGSATIPYYFLPGHDGSVGIGLTFNYAKIMSDDQGGYILGVAVSLEGLLERPGAGLGLLFRR